MDSKKICDGAVELMAALRAQGFAGTWVLQGQYGIPAIDNLRFHLENWEKLGPVGQEMHLVLSVNMDWGMVSYVQNTFFITCDRELGVWVNAAEAVKLGRLSNIEIARIRWEPVGHGNVPTLSELRMDEEVKYRKLLK